jgi:hypothetical protein
MRTLFSEETEYGPGQPDQKCDAGSAALKGLCVAAIAEWPAAIGCMIITA